MEQIESKLHPELAAALESQEISREVLIEKYAKNGEQTPAEVRRRVAHALAANEKEITAGLLTFGIQRELSKEGKSI